MHTSGRRAGGLPPMSSISSDGCWIGGLEAGQRQGMSKPEVNGGGAEIGRREVDEEMGWELTGEGIRSGGGGQLAGMYKSERRSLLRNSLLPNPNRVHFE